MRLTPGGICQTKLSVYVAETALIALVITLDAGKLKKAIQFYSMYINKGGYKAMSTENINAIVNEYFE